MTTDKISYNQQVNSAQVISTSSISVQTSGAGTAKFAIPVNIDAILDTYSLTLEQWQALSSEKQQEYINGYNDALKGDFAYPRGLCVEVNPENPIPDAQDGDTLSPEISEGAQDGNAISSKTSEETISANIKETLAKYPSLEASARALAEAQNRSLDQLDGRAKNEFITAAMNNMTNDLLVAVCNKKVEDITPEEKIEAYKKLSESKELSEPLREKFDDKFNEEVLRQQLFDERTGNNKFIEENEPSSLDIIFGDNKNAKLNAKWNEINNTSYDSAEKKAKAQVKCIADGLETYLKEHVDTKDPEQVRHKIQNLMITCRNKEDFELLNRALVRVKGRQIQRHSSEIRRDFGEDNKRIAYTVISKESIKDMSPDALGFISEELVEEAKLGNDYLVILAGNNPELLGNENLTEEQKVDVATYINSQEVLENQTITNKLGKDFCKIVVGNRTELGKESDGMLNGYSTYTEDATEVSELLDILPPEGQIRCATSTNQILAKRTQNGEDIDNLLDYGQHIRSYADNLPETEAVSYLKDLSDTTSQYAAKYQSDLFKLDMSSKYEDVQKYVASNIYKLDESVRQEAVSYTKSLGRAEVTNSIQSNPPANNGKSSMSTAANASITESTTQNTTQVVHVATSNNVTNPTTNSTVSQTERSNSDSVTPEVIRRELEEFTKLSPQEQSAVLKEIGIKNISPKMCDECPALISHFVRAGRGLELVRYGSTNTRNEAIALMKKDPEQRKQLAAVNPNLFAKSTQEDLAQRGVLKKGNTSTLGHELIG